MFKCLQWNAIFSAIAIAICAGEYAFTGTLPTLYIALGATDAISSSFALDVLALLYIGVSLFFLVIGGFTAFAAGSITFIGSLALINHNDIVSSVITILIAVAVAVGAGYEIAKQERNKPFPYIVSMLPIVGLVFGGSWLLIKRRREAIAIGRS
jgi:hypothetical protein